MSNSVVYCALDAGGGEVARLQVGRSHRHGSLQLDEEPKDHLPHPTARNGNPEGGRAQPCGCAWVGGLPRRSHPLQWDRPLRCPGGSLGRAGLAASLGAAAAACPLQCGHLKTNQGIPPLRDDGRARSSASRRSGRTRDQLDAGFGQYLPGCSIQPPA